MGSPCKGKNKKECEKIRLEMIRHELKIIDSLLLNISKNKIDKKYISEAKKYISAIRYYISHKRSWPKGYQDRERPSIEEVWNLMQKGIPIVECAEILARSAPMDSEQKRARDRLLCNLRKPTTWVPRPPKVEGSDVKGDPANIHPANIRYIAEQKKRGLLDRRNELHAEKQKKTDAQREAENKERAKVTKRQRKERKEHFKRLDALRSGEKKDVIKIGS